MDQSVVQSNVDDAIKHRNESDDTVATVVEHATGHPYSSYRLTRWPVINRILDFVDTVTHGRVALVVRFVSYLFFGGTAALVNLAVFALGLLLLPASFDPFTRTLVADIIACEVSLIANFIPNDYFTFRYMAGRQRPWIVRCARFHMTGMVGFLLTVILQQFFSHGVHIYPLLGQALAILIVLIYNFTFHHLFTYRRIASHASTTH